MEIDPPNKMKAAQEPEELEECGHDNARSDDIECPDCGCDLALLDDDEEGA